MSTIKPSVLCVVKNTLYNNDKIVTVVAPCKAGDIIDSPYTPLGLRIDFTGWVVEGDLMMGTNQSVKPRPYKRGPFAPDQLRPLGGDDLGITEEDVKELYQPNLTKEKVS